MSHKKNYLLNPPNLCGPYSIYNAKIWKENKVLDVDDLVSRCKTDYFGTRNEWMSKVLHEEFKIEDRKTNDPKKIKEALSKGYGIILGFRSGHTDGHYAFFFQENNIIYSVSDKKDNTIVKSISKSTFDSYLKKYYIQCVGSGLRITHPKAWFIKK